MLRFSHQWINIIIRWSGSDMPPRSRLVLTYISATAICHLPWKPMVAKMVAIFYAFECIYALKRCEERMINVNFWISDEVWTHLPAVNEFLRIELNCRNVWKLQRAREVELPPGASTIKRDITQHNEDYPNLLQPRQHKTAQHRWSVCDI